jgi:hypothetical protein
MGSRARTRTPINEAKTKLKLVLHALLLLTPDFFLFPYNGLNGKVGFAKKDNIYKKLIVESSPTR